MQLCPPQRGQAPHTGCCDDAIVERVGRVAKSTIATHGLDMPVTSGGEVQPRTLDQLLVDVNRRHLSRLTDNVGEQRRIVAGAGADLQNTLAWFEAQLLQRQCHNCWSGGGTERASVRLPNGCNRLILIDFVQCHAGQEQMTRNSTESS